MKTTARINELYFIQKKSIKEIAEIVNTSKSYISRVLIKDKRYKKEKNNRTKEKMIQRKELQKKQIYSKRKSKSSNNISNMQILQQMHNQDVSELSEHRNLGNQALRKWCSSVYKYNSDKNRYEFDTEKFTRSFGLPLYIKT